MCMIIAHTSSYAQAAEEQSKLESERREAAAADPQTGDVEMDTDVPSSAKPGGDADVDMDVDESGAAKSNEKERKEREKKRKTEDDGGDDAVVMDED
jgi:hypothetical protein